MAFLVETGPNSAMIQWNTGEGQAVIRPLLEAFILARGWAIHDAVSATVVCYVANNADGVTKKYLVIEYASSYFYTKVYESWNAVTHVGTNLAHHSDNATYAQRFASASSGVLHIACSPRYLLLFSKTGGVNGNGGGGNSDVNFGAGGYAAPSGIVEITRDNEGDTPEKGYPTYAWVNFGLLAGMYTNASNTQGQFGFSFPRSPVDGLAANASQFNVLSTLYGRSLIETTAQQNRDHTLSTNSQGMHLTLPQRLDPVGLRPYVLTPYAANFHSAQFFGIKGRFFGLKVVGPSNVLYPFDQLDIPVDAGGFYDEEGTLQRHFLWRATTNTGAASGTGGVMFALPL